MNAWENVPHDPPPSKLKIEMDAWFSEQLNNAVPHDPLMDDEELEELWNRLPRPMVYPETSWWHKWWPKLACLGGVFGFWLLFWWEASR